MPPLPVLSPGGRCQMEATSKVFSKGSDQGKQQNIFEYIRLLSWFLFLSLEFTNQLINVTHCYILLAGNGPYLRVTQGPMGPVLSYGRARLALRSGCGVAAAHLPRPCALPDGLPTIGAPWRWMEAYGNPTKSCGCRDHLNADASTSVISWCFSSTTDIMWKESRGSDQIKSIAHLFAGFPSHLRTPHAEVLAGHGGVDPPGSTPRTRGRTDQGGS